MNVRYILLLLILCAPLLGVGQSRACKDPVFIRLRSAQRDCVGQRAEFEVTAENVVNYQWQASNPSSPDYWFNLSFESTNTSTLSFITDMVWNHYAFRCKLTGTCSEIIYTPTTYIFVYQPNTDTTPIITSPTESTTRSVPENSTTILEVKADEDWMVNWGYQWQYSPSASGDWFNLKDEVENELYVTTFPDRSGYRYRCLVKGCPSAYTGVTTLNVVSSDISNNYNAIKETVLLQEADENTDVAHLPVDDKSVTTSYFDGLGRGMQTVSWQASPLKNDIIQPVAFDKYGREVRKYLPFAAEQTNGYYLFNHLIIDASGDYSGPASTFYAQGSDNNVADDPKPWAQTVFEASSLNRVLKQGAPGEAWQPSGIAYVEKQYGSNQTNEVILFDYDETTGQLDFTENGALKYYDPSQLYANNTLDEHNNEVIEYIDKEGKTILKKVQYKEENGVKSYAKTYYIYDDFGNLVMVLPPEASEAINASIAE